MSDGSAKIEVRENSKADIISHNTDLEKNCPWKWAPQGWRIWSQPVIIVLVVFLMFTEAATRGVLWKKLFLKTSQISCEIKEIFTNTYFEEYLWTTASVFIPYCRAQKQPLEDVFKMGILKNFTIFTGAFLWILQNF